MNMAIWEDPMPREYSIANAKDHLAEAVRATEAGDPVTLTHRGRPVAVLLSLAAYEDLSSERPSFWKTASAIHRAAASDGIEFSEADFAGLRAESPGRDLDT